jgi:hypothetical protein
MPTSQPCIHLFYQVRVCVSVCLFLCVRVCVCLSLCVRVCLCVSLSVCVSLCLSVCASLSASVCLCVSPSVRLCVSNPPISLAFLLYCFRYPGPAHQPQQQRPCTEASLRRLRDRQGTVQKEGQRAGCALCAEYVKGSRRGEEGTWFPCKGPGEGKRGKGGRRETEKGDILISTIA